MDCPLCCWIGMCRGSAVDVDVSRRKSSIWITLFAINGAKDKETGDGQTPRCRSLWIDGYLIYYLCTVP